MNPEDIPPGDLIDRDIGPITILFGLENGKYPYGNSFTVTGTEQSVIVDPCLGIVARKDRLPDVDMVLHSHTHEDHISGTYLFGDVPWYAHVDDALGLESIEGLMDMYGLEGEAKTNFQHMIETTFNYPFEKSEVRAFEDGDVFDLGGVTIRVLHTPGHTRGHCCFLVEWGANSNEKFVYLGDIELTGFGPYYGDAWSDLEDFERSIELLHHVDASWWLTFHHKGLIESREKFLAMLDSFGAMIGKRETRLLEYIKEPRTMQDIVDHRFVFRPGAEGIMVEAVEERSMAMHLERLIRQGRVSETDGKFVVNE